MRKLFLILALMVANFMVIASPNDYLIKPTGSYKVSMQEFLWQNSNICPDYFYTRTDSWFYQNNPLHCHVVDTYIYYPTTTISNNYDSYWAKNIIELNHDIKNKIIESKNLSAAYNVKQLMFDQKSYVISQQNIAKGKFPLLIFQPGLGFNSYNYLNFISNLVSHGYIVVAIDSAYNQNIIESYGTLGSHISQSHNGKMSSSSAAAVVAAQKSNLTLALSDYKFVLNKLKTDSRLCSLTSHMDFSKIGGFGHSLGSTSIYINSLESSNVLKGYISLDIGSSNDLPIHVYNPVIPTLFLRAANDRDFGKTIDTTNQFNLKENQYVALMTPFESDICYSTHRAFTDVSTTYYGNNLINLWYNVYGQPDINLAEFMYSDHINGQDLSKSINQYLLVFFDNYLKNVNSVSLKECHSLNPNSILYCGPKIIQ